MKSRRRTKSAAGLPQAVLVLLTIFLSVAASAHTPSETYFTLSLGGTNLSGRWDVALRDLHQGMGLGAEEAKKIAAADLQQREEALALDILGGVNFRADGARLSIIATDYTTLPLNGIEYARLLFQGRLSRAPQEIEIDARVAFRIDTNMHGLLRLEHNGRTEVVAFNEQRSAHRFNLAEPGGSWARWATFVWEGSWHIWIGFDHVLFLVALLLPSVLKREAKRWVGVEKFREAFINVLKIVTAFTMAHSVTLTLSVLNVVRLPTRFVEFVIAASVAIAAINNVWPLFRGKSWPMAFGFGLIHGFGFANVLVGIELASRSLAAGLVGFNVGVELGQLAIVVVFLPLAFGLRRTVFYYTITLKLGSLLVSIIAMTWMFERLFDKRLAGFY